MQLADELLKSFAKITNDKEKRKDDSVKGTVVVQDNETYVQLDGSDVLTPVDVTSNSKNNDRVLVVIKNHKATIIGNFTDPSATTEQVGEVSANVLAVRELAEEASDAAGQAQESAEAASTSAGLAWNKAVSAENAANAANAQAARAESAADAAEQKAEEATSAASTAQEQAAAATTAANEAKTQSNAAKQQAERADKYANSALDQLGVVQDVVGVLSWASEHGSFTKTTDQELQNGKVYFTYDGTDYTPVVTPDASQLSNYYELTVDEAMQSYIMAHLAVTNRGLWVLPSGINTGSVTPASGETESDARARLGSNYKVLLSSSGMIVYDGAGVEVASYGESIEFNSSRPQYIGGEDAYIIFYDADHDDIPDSIRIGGDKVFIGSDKKLSDVLTSLDISTRQTEHGAEITIKDQTVNLNNGADAVLLRIDSSRGNLFKNNMVSTVLSVSVFKAGVCVKTSSELTSVFGTNAYLQWYWKRIGDTEFHEILRTDSRLLDNGFMFNLSPEDVDTKVVFQCDLIY